MNARIWMKATRLRSRDSRGVGERGFEARTAYAVWVLATLVRTDGATWVGPAMCQACPSFGMAVPTRRRSPPGTPPGVLDPMLWAWRTCRVEPVSGSCS